MLDLGCGPGRHLAALRGAGKRGLGVDLSPVAVAARARPRRATRSTARCGRRSRAPARWRTILLLDGNIGIGGAPIALLRRAGELLAPAARSSSRPTRRARRRTASGSGWRRRASSPSGSAGRGSGVDGVGRGRGARRASRSRRPRARGPHLRNAADAPEDSQTAMLPAPPGPFRPGFLRSPLRGPWLTSALGSILLVLITIVATTGFLSHAAYMPDLAGNAIVPARPRPAADASSTGRPARRWLYALTQGLHTNVGLVAIPFLLAKLWSVIPRLFAFPPVTQPGAGDRAALDRAARLERGVRARHGRDERAVLVPVQVQLRGRALLRRDRLRRLAGAARDRQDAGDRARLPRARRAQAAARRPREHAARAGRRARRLVTPNPAAPTISRRGLFAFAGAGALASAGGNVGQSIGGPLRKLAFLAPRREDRRRLPGQQDRAAAAGVTRGDDRRRATGSCCASATARSSLTREELLALPQRTARLPIACVEGWSTTQEWTGVRLSRAGRARGRAGRERGARRVAAAEAGVLRRASLTGAQIAADDALLALKVNGEDLSMDHGYPARIIVPALPGRAQHEVGRPDDLPEGVMAALRRLPDPPARAPRRCCRWRAGRC